MAGEELGCAGGDPVWESVVIFERRFDLPTHDQVHDEDDSDLLGNATDVGKRSQDISEELGEGM